MNENEKRRYKGIAGRIMAALTEKDMTTRELARKAGMTEVKLARFLNRKGGMSGEDMRKIAEALGVSLDWLLGDLSRSMGTEQEKRPAGVPPLGWLMTRLASDSWVRIYETRRATSLEAMEPVYDAEAMEVRFWSEWERVRLKDVVLIRAVNDPDTVDPVVEVYI